MGSFVQLTSLDGTASPAWVARPDVPARGAVVVLQEIFGVNAHIRAVADRLAARGYMAVAPSLFTRVEAGVDLDRKSTRLNSSHSQISYAVFCLKKKTIHQICI